MLWAAAAGSETTEAPSERASYSLGHQIGTDLALQAVTIDAAALRQGIEDALAERPPALAHDEMQALLIGLKQEIVSTQQQERRRGAQTHRRQGAAFLSENARQANIVELESGLQYRVIHPGHGRQPSSADRVEVRYRSALIDGTVFHDSLRDSEATETLHVSGVVRGLTEALQLMREGAHWQVFAPADLAYGRRGPVADRAVVFDVELISIVSPQLQTAEVSP